MPSTPQSGSAMDEARERANSLIESELNRLRQNFDERLSSLNEPDAGDRLRKTMATNKNGLQGKVKAGETSN